MAVLDEDFGTGLTLVEGNGGVRSSPVLVPERAPRDWRSQCERERARADAAEARAEELRWAEVASRSDAGSWKSRFKACRHRLSEAVEETKEARRVARDVPSLQAEVARLETLLCEAGVESNEDSTIEALRSLLNHREGLSVFVDRPQVPLDNNRAERLLRGPAIGRRLSFGSDSEDGARFTAIMYSVVGTLSMNGIDILSWLDTWLAACAENDRKPPDDLSPWLPWSMSEERRRELMAPA